MKHSLRNIAIAASLVVAAASTWAAGAHDHEHAGDSAIGQPGAASAVTRTIRVDMNDAMRFSPADIRVKQGEVLRFVINNVGQLKHEFVIGTEQELKAHYELMKKHPEMEHAEPNMLTLAAGQSGEIIWQFTQAGKVNFACLQPGHLDAGMKGIVKVSKTNTNAKTKK